MDRNIKEELVSYLGDLYTVINGATFKPQPSYQPYITDEYVLEFGEIKGYKSIKLNKVGEYTRLYVTCPDGKCPYPII